MNQNIEKIDWTKKFKEFLDNQTDDEIKREFLLKYYTFTKRINSEIQPSDIFNIYQEVIKK